MSTSEEIHRLESELETHKSELRQDAARINDKIEETKAQLRPANFVRHRPGLTLLVAFILGMGIHFLLSRSELRAEEVRPHAQKIGKPLTRGILTKAGKQAATRTVRGRQ